ncbi:uncharacterized protein LOC108734412 [Agrilus planipennis]|uniref:Uncharacterized protein LOC108734412 n=1 Tax=Agrilus planipennis TaxID=224129 RepID=A0A1W4WBW3_AGRPL|nr:uncharacterized protein LOC108734412 [Agrilus planipennis]
MRTTLKLLFILIIGSAECSKIIRDLIQWNVAGLPVLHKTVSIPFDPDVAIRRSRLYQEVNGYHGEKALERLGLGIDGNDLQRLEQQQTRDKDILGRSYDEYNK